MFHDRGIPGTRANIDHIVVGPNGVFVIETKNMSGKVEVRRGELLIAGRRKQAFVEEAWREAAAVQQALSSEFAHIGIDVRPLLCVHRATLPWRKVVVAGVPVVGPKGMVRSLRDGPARLTSREVAHIAAAIDERLRAA